MRGPKPSRSNWSRAAQADAARRRGIAMRLWQEGHTYEQIAMSPDPDRGPGATLYASRQTAHQAVKLGLERLEKPAAEEMLAMLTARHHAAYMAAAAIATPEHVDPDNPPDPTVQLRALAEMRGINAELAKLYGVYDLDAKMGAYLAAETARTLGLFQSAFEQAMAALGLAEDQQATAYRVVADHMRSALDGAAGQPAIEGVVV